MIIAQISDPHLRKPGSLLFGAVDTHGALSRAVDRVAALRPDAAIVTGDLVHDGDAEDYAELTALLERLKAPVFAVPGNHDERELARRALAFTGVMPAGGKLNFAADCGDLRLIGLDSLVVGSDGGELGDEQREWLEVTLGAAPERPTLVIVHHPPVATGIGFMDDIRLADAAALAALLARHRQVRLVACGHVHRMIVGRLGDVPVVIAPGVAHQVALDLAPGAPSRWIAEPPAILVHRWQPHTGFVTHMAYVDDFGETRPFSLPHAFAPDAGGS